MIRETLEERVARRKARHAAKMERLRQACAFAKVLRADRKIEATIRARNKAAKVRRAEQAAKRREERAARAAAMCTMLAADQEASRADREARRAEREQWAAGGAQRKAERDAKWDALRMQRQADWLARRAERETKRAARALSPKASKRRCFPWRTMEIGDSFLANTPHIRTSAHAMGKYYGKKFSVRKTPEGLRVWRIA